MAELNLALHQFQDQTINQTAEDTLISGVLIPKGYVNATEMCKANGKRWVKYLEYSKTQEYLCLLRESLPGTDLIFTISDSVNELRGTWVHHFIALDLASWVSAKFKLWANETLWHVLTANYDALNEQSLETLKLRQEEGRKLWQEIRTTGIKTRRTLTDSIKDWYERNPGGTSCPYHAMFAKVTNAIYQALWSMDAVSLEALLNCDRNESRNHMDAESLRLLERAEAIVAEFIDEDNIKPVDAVALARIRKAKAQPTAD